MRSLTFFVVLAAVAATLAEALPWAHGHPLAALVLLCGLACLAGWYRSNERCQRVPDASILPADDDGGDGSC